ncbi:MAG: hypothetical protein ACOC1K_08085, partial [Nanoarchaeota archaeon]
HFFKEFQDWDPGLIKDMRECFHFENNQNPYHLEGDVWSHTCMVINQFFQRKPEERTIEVFLALLCHDIGKIYTREVRKNGNVSFFSHSFASIQPCIDFLHHLKNKGFNISRDTFISVLTIVSNHIDFMRASDYDRVKLSNFDKDLYRDSITHMKCDHLGRICKRDDTREEMIQVQRPIYRNSPIVTLLCGLPGSGKDYFLDQNRLKESSVSFDDIRIRLYRENYDCSGLNDREIYHRAFNFCNDKKIDLNSFLKRDVNKLLEKGYKEIYVNNLNLRRKARRKIMNLLGRDLGYKAIFIGREYKDIILSNINRSSKFIPLDIIDWMSKNIHFPCAIEGFREIGIKID